MNTCKVCNKELKNQQRMYCSVSCKSRGHYVEKVINRNTTFSQYKKADERKKQFISIKGGGCKICGYNKNYSALDFHHTGIKNFPMDARNIGNRKIDNLLKELEGCDLLCANCHREIHHPECLLTPSESN